MPGQQATLTGKILFAEDAQPFSGATVYIRWEDVSRVDDCSHLVAERVIDNVSFQAGQAAGLEFHFEEPIPDERASYAVQVHVDVDGDGQVSRGDYVNMESYPVATHGFPTQVTVRVRRVG